MIQRENFTIAANGTTSNYLGGQGMRLVGLVLPTLDSTTIEFEAQSDASDVSIHTNTGTPAAITLGAANTGARVQAVPEDVGRISAVLKVRLKTAAQTGGARTIVALFERTGA